jgi:hypothetical protein
MDHEFELAFNLLDGAGGRIQTQQYGITRILFHNHGDIQLTTVHDYSRETGHRLGLFANDDHGQMAAVEATAPDLATDPITRILKIRAGEVTFNAVPGTWSYPATAGGHTYTLTANVGDEPMWTTTIDHAAPVGHHALDAAIGSLLERCAASPSPPTHRVRTASAPATTTTHKENPHVRHRFWPSLGLH